MNNLRKVTITTLNCRDDGDGTRKAFEEIER